MIFNTGVIHALENAFIKALLCMQSCAKALGSQKLFKAIYLGRRKEHNVTLEDMQMNSNTI